MSATSHTKPHVLVLVGPTCSGKTAVSLALASHLNGEIISADSRQVFKYLDIGTAKPSSAERHEIRHYFVDELLPDQEFNAGQFGERGREVIQAISKKNKLPIVAGGSGLYVRSLIDGLFEGPGADMEFRATMEKNVREGHLSRLLEELKRLDPESAARIDSTKPRRIIRALEVHRSAGKPLSQLQKELKVAIDFSPVLFGLLWEREVLYRRIEARCERMIEEGMFTEVEKLRAMGFDDSLNALNTVGYAEAFAYTRGEMSYNEFVRLFKQNSRRYAKRQMTWFRRDARVKWIEMNDKRSAEDVAREIGGEFLKVAEAGGVDSDRE